MVNKNLIGGASVFARIAIVCLIVALCQAGKVPNAAPWRSAIELAVQSEMQVTRDLRGKRCVGLASGIGVDEGEVLRDLRAKGLTLQNSGWCVRHLEGVEVEVFSPIVEAGPGLYEITVEVGDMVIAPGEHFATLLRRGKYLIPHQPQRCARPH
jgi:hypothetical protein